MSVVGEIRTSLVQTSAALGDDEVVAMLDLLPGRFVHRVSRPVPYAASPERFAGVDCSLPMPRSRGVRAVGTVGHRTIVTGGHIIQGSASAEIRRGPDGRRRAWSHYLASPGRLETIGKGDPDDAATSFLDDARDAGLLDLGSVADQAIDAAQDSFGALDRRPPLRVPRGRLRWSAVFAEARPSVRLRLQDGAIRTASLVLPPDSDLAAARGFCEDLALHDWLLTTVDHVVRRSGIGRRPSPAIVARLRPAIDHLLHLWAPGTRRAPSGPDLWPAVEDATGLDQQWQALIRRIRDQLALPAFEPLKEYAV